MITFFVSIMSYAVAMAGLHGDFIKIDPNSYDAVLDVRYATHNNFTKTVLYTAPDVYLHKDAAKALKIASTFAKVLGYQIKIFDGFRPVEIQQQMWDIVQDPRYVTEPEKGECTHCRGVALDVTLVNQDGTDVEMGTDFDDFTTKAHSTYLNLTQRQIHNRAILSGIMSIAGFQSIPTEWWHFQLKNWEMYKKHSEKEIGVKIKK